MKKSIFFLISLIVLFGCQKEKVTTDYLITNVTVIDVKNGVLQPNKHVAIEGNKIDGIYDEDVFLKIRYR